MGFLVLNMSVGTDWATGNNERFVEFHMRLPVPKSLYDEQSNLLRDEKWDDAAKLLIKKFPQHKSIIECWYEGSSQRSQTEKGSSEPTSIQRISDYKAVSNL